MANEQSPLLGGPSEEYTIFSPHQKLMIVIAATSASIFSPLAANIYYPALISIRKELHISKELLNTTITSYMIFQGLSPMFIASYSDTIGRRPVYIFCFVAYIAANIALAYQNTFIGILLLRCLQSTGSSSTVNLAYSVTADVVTSSERGRYIGFASVGPIIGPSFGPVLGGIISQQFGWRYIFIFLAAAATVVFIILLGFLPETCSTIVGNGSVPPSSAWNKSIVSWPVYDRNSTNDSITGSHGIVSTRKKSPKTPNPLRTLCLLFEYPTGCVLLYNGFIFAVYYSIMSSLTFSFHDNYHFDDVQIGLAYVPIGMGTMLAAIGNGFLVDWNYRRVATALGLKVSKGRNLDHDDCKRAGFSIEKARLQVVIPMALLANMSMLGYAWSIHLHLNPIIPLIILLIFGFAGTAAYSCMNVLIVDLNPDSTATATAANNLVRCFLGSVATAIIMPMIDAIGIGGAFSVIAGVWMSLSPVALLLLFQTNNRE